jgi:hypothetical protein
MAGAQRLNFESPDETRTPDKTRVGVVHAGGTAVARLVLEPGWTWSECIKPVPGTDSCQGRHVGLVQSGTMRVTNEDGTKETLQDTSSPNAPLRSTREASSRRSHAANVLPMLGPRCSRRMKL